MNFVIKLNSFNKFNAASEDYFSWLNDAHNVHFNDALLLLLYRNKFHTLDKSLDSAFTS